MDESSKALEQAAASISVSALTGAKQAKLNSLLAILAVSIIGLVLAWLISRSVIKLLGGEPAEAAAAVRAIAAGDLTMNIAVSAGDDTSLLANLQQMKESLVNIISQV
ncbi:MAG: hypothetical protein RL748_2332, partial [Pseudomonadota bacterium]